MQFAAHWPRRTRERCRDARSKAMRTEECHRGDAPAHGFFAATVQRSSTTAAISTRASCARRTAGMPSWKPPRAVLGPRAEARSFSATRARSGSRPELAGARKRRHQDAQGLRSASETVGRQHAMEHAVRKNPAEVPFRNRNEFNARSSQKWCTR